MESGPLDLLMAMSLWNPPRFLDSLRQFMVEVKIYDTSWIDLDSWMRVELSGQEFRPVI